MSDSKFVTIVETWRINEDKSISVFWMLVDSNGWHLKFVLSKKQLQLEASELKTWTQNASCPSQLVQPGASDHLISLVIILLAKLTTELENLSWRSKRSQDALNTSESELLS